VPTPNATKAAGKSKETDPAVAEILEALPDDVPKEVVQTIIQSVSYQAPMPPPSMLAGYERVLKGSANRLLVCMEKEQEGRLTDNRKRVHTDRIRVFGAIAVALGLIGAAMYATYLDRPEIAIPLGLAGTITGIVRAVTSWLEHRKKN
jgi:uncharacterized membrane protein